MEYHPYLNEALHLESYPIIFKLSFFREITKGIGVHSMNGY